MCSGSTLSQTCGTHILSPPFPIALFLGPVPHSFYPSIWPLVLISLRNYEGGIEDMASVRMRLPGLMCLKCVLAEMGLMCLEM